MHAGASVGCRTSFVLDAVQSNRWGFTLMKPDAPSTGLPRLLGAENANGASPTVFAGGLSVPDAAGRRCIFSALKTGRAFMLFLGKARAVVPPICWTPAEIANDEGC